MKRLIASSFIAIVVTQPTLAQDTDRWQAIGANLNGETVLWLDRESVQVEGTLRTAWTRLAVHREEGGAAYVLGRTRFNCRDRTYMVLNIHEYAADGTAQTNAAVPPAEARYEPVPPESLIEIALQSVCEAPPS